MTRRRYTVWVFDKLAFGNAILAKLTDQGKTVSDLMRETGVLRSAFERMMRVARDPDGDPFAAGIDSPNLLNLAMWLGRDPCEFLVDRESVDGEQAV